MGQKEREGDEREEGDMVAESNEKRVMKNRLFKRDRQNSPATGPCC